MKILAQSTDGVDILVGAILGECPNAAARKLEELDAKLFCELANETWSGKRRFVTVKRDWRTILTLAGAVTFRRRYYLDRSTGRYTHPLDAAMGLCRYSRASADVRLKILGMAGECPYRYVGANAVPGQVLSKSTVCRIIRDTAVASARGKMDPREKRRPRPNRREIHLDDREKAQIQVHNGDDIRGKENGRRKECPDEQDAHLGCRSRRRRREDKRRPVRGLRPKRRLLRLPLRRLGGLHTKLPRAADVQGDLRPRQMARLPISLLQREPRQGRGCAEKAGIHRRNRRHDRAFGGRRQSLQALERQPQNLRSVGEGRLPRLLPGGHELPLLRPAVRQIRQQIQKGDRRDALDGPRGQGERLGTEDIVQVTT